MEDKGLNEMEKAGGVPQKLSPDARGVSLTRPESTFLDHALSALTDDPFYAPDEEAIDKARREACLPQSQADFIRSWIANKGDLFAMSETDFVDPGMFTRFLCSPLVFRILTEAAVRCPNIPAPIPSKEELAVTWGMISRTASMPLPYQKEARVELAKLMDYYPDSRKGVSDTNIQINFVNPYAGGEEGVTIEADKR